MDSLIYPVRMGFGIAILGCAAAVAVLLPAHAAVAQPVLISAPQTVGPEQTTITSTAGGPAVPLATAEITVRGTTLTINGRHAIASLRIEDDAMLTHDAAFVFDYSGGAGTSVVHGCVLDVAGDVVIDGAIDVTGKGFSAGLGPGAGVTSGMGKVSGAGHAGRGTSAGGAPGVTYGDALAPALLGSGGGSSGGPFGQGPGDPGGGAIVLSVQGAMVLDGAISANGGTDGGGGGGSGGSVWLTAREIKGQGSISANGSDGAGGGGGGRISVSGDLTDAQWVTTAFGGLGSDRAGAGTVYLDHTRLGVRVLTIENIDSPAAETAITAREAMATTHVRFGTHATPLLANEPSWAFQGLTIEPSARVLLPMGDPVAISVARDLTIPEGAVLDGVGRGFGRGSGPGAGRTAQSRAGGGAHGGRGGTNEDARGGLPYGEPDFPVTMGSGGGDSIGPFGRGPGDRGGGALEVRVDGVLTIDGTIDMSAQRGSGGGGGAGGSVLLRANAVLGEGQILARGSPTGGNPGGGGGGRVAIHTCGERSSSLTADVSGGMGVNPGEAGTVYFGTATVAMAETLPACVGTNAVLAAEVLGADATAFVWYRGNDPLADGATPWGSIVSGAASGSLTIRGVTAQDAGLYRAVAITPCGTASGPAVVLDVYCACDPISFLAGIDDRFALPQEATSPSPSLVDVLVARRPGRPFHQFDEVPGVTAGVEEDSRLAHTFGGLPPDIVAAELTMRLRAGSDGSATSVAEGTDSIRLGFAEGDGAAAVEDRAWERRLGGTDLDPDAGLIAGQIWTSGDQAMLTLDLAALPLDRPLGDLAGRTLDLRDAMGSHGFLDVTVVDETAVDFVRLDARTSPGLVAPWAVGPLDSEVCEGERVELLVRAEGIGAPFAYQWRMNGQPIDPATNPTAQSATLVIESFLASDAGLYDCIVDGDNTCGSVTTEPAELGVGRCCLADLDGDGELTIFDFLAFQNAFDAMDPVADFDGDGEFTIFDFLAFQNAFDAGCS